MEKGGRCRPYKSNDVLDIHCCYVGIMLVYDHNIFFRWMYYLTWFFILSCLFVLFLFFRQWLIIFVRTGVKPPSCGGSSGCRDESTTKNMSMVQGMECLDRGMGRGECCMIKEHDQIKTVALIKGRSTGQAVVARSSGSNGGNQQLLWVCSTCRAMLLESSEHQWGKTLGFCLSPQFCGPFKVLVLGSSNYF